MRGKQVCPQGEEATGVSLGTGASTWAETGTGASSGDLVGILRYSLKK